MRRAGVLVVFLLCSSSLTAAEWRVIEFVDHPDSNVGAPHVIAAARPWPTDVEALRAAVATAVEKPFVGVADVRRGPATEGAVAELAETRARLVGVDDQGAHIRMRIAGAPGPVEVTVPLNGTVVVGGERDDDRHAFVAISLFDATTAAGVADFYTPRDPAVTAPKAPAGARLRATAAPSVKAVPVDVDVAPDGSVIAVHVLTHDAADAARLESTVRGWKFTPAMRDGKPVRAIAVVGIPFAR